jgi:hypothetical protein
MIQVIENGIISEPELMDFVMGYQKLVKAKMVSELSFLNLMEDLGIEFGLNDEIILDENNIYILSE